MNILLSGKNITKSFDSGSKKLVVLNDVSVDINEGEFIAIMGASGSGKSTLLYSLSAMDSIDLGEIIFNGKNLSKMEDKILSDIRRNEMGFVFQQPTLLKNLNIIDNIIFPQLRDRGKEIKELTKKAERIMEQLGIIDLKERSISQVSGGQLQRADISRALMNEPKLLFADEPTGALNSKTSAEIMDIFQYINEKGTAILLVTHDVKVAGKAQRVLFMKDGKIQGDLRFAQAEKNDSNNKIERVMERAFELGI